MRQIPFAAITTNFETLSFGRYETDCTFTNAHRIYSSAALRRRRRRDRRRLGADFLDARRRRRLEPPFFAARPNQGERWNDQRASRTLALGRGLLGATATLLRHDLNCAVCRLKTSNSLQWGKGRRKNRSQGTLPRLQTSHQTLWKYVFVVFLVSKIYFKM